MDLICFYTKYQNNPETLVLVPRWIQLTRLIERIVRMKRKKKHACAAACTIHTSESLLMLI